MITELTEQEVTALTLLKSVGGNIVDAALIAKEALTANRGQVKRVRRCLAAGIAELRKREKTVTFETAVEAALEARQERRARTQWDFRYMTRRFMRRCKGLSERRVRAITPQECAAYIETAFDTPRQRQKARLILSGVFGTAVKRGWCDANPVAKVEVPRVVETPVPVLTPQEIEEITTAAESYHNGNCAAAVGMMLYAGIRPHEVSRLTWAEVDLQERAIYIHPLHSKTGGARRVTIHKPLQRILERHKQKASENICPGNWAKHWRHLRQDAGWRGDKKWPQDALRHTFASYHLSYFRSYEELQIEIGHRDSTLLRTRYLCMNGVMAAARFWAA
ncbi:MAG: tyrosine-type recombinase/integrase [Akkermansia sp.]|nr:tyrosine-type recombinase/integrase [Akkermansia sp.]